MLLKWVIILQLIFIHNAILPIYKLIIMDYIIMWIVKLLLYYPEHFLKTLQVSQPQPPRELTELERRFRILELSQKDLVEQTRKRGE